MYAASQTSPWQTYILSSYDITAYRNPKMLLLNTVARNTSAVLHAMLGIHLLYMDECLGKNISREAQ